MGNTLTPEQTQALIDALGGNVKPDIVKQNGVVYQVQPDGSARAVEGIPPEQVKPDTSPTTIHVPGKGWLQYSAAAGGWGIIQGTEETPEAPKTPTFTLSDGRTGVIKVDANGNPFGQALGGDNPADATRNQVVSPGQGVVKPDGSVSVPVAAPASKTPEQIAAESQANVSQSNASTNLANAQANNIITPAQRIAEIRASAQAQADSALKLVQDKIDAGLELSEKDKLELQNSLAGILAETQSKLRQAEAQGTFDREQPNKTRELDIQQQSADTQQQNAVTNAAQVENSRINNERQAQFQRDQGQATVLTAQAQQGQQMLDRVVKAGVAPSMSSLKAAINPLQMAFQIMQGQVKDGSLSPDNLPTPMAPRPAGVTSAMSVPAPAQRTDVSY